jgi:hypothetical protein
MCEPGDAASSPQLAEQASLIARSASQPTREHSSHASTSLRAAAPSKTSKHNSAFRRAGAMRSSDHDNRPITRPVSSGAASGT